MEAESLAASKLRMRNERAVDADAFRAVMRQLASSVTVITTETDGALYGFTATAVCSVCATPPTLLIVVNKSARTHMHVDAKGAFVVSILASDQKHLAERFSTKGDDQFNEVEYVLNSRGLPLINGAAAHIECEVQDRIPIGTHTVFVAQIVDVDVGSHRPLIYHDARYGLVAPM